MTEARINHYRAQGWKLRVDHWRNGHNGDDEETVYFKSPRLKEEQAIFSANDLTDLDEKKMLASELRTYVQQRLDHWENRDALIDPLVKALTKDPDAKKVTITVNLA